VRESRFVIILDLKLGGIADLVECRLDQVTKPKPKALSCRLFRLFDSNPSGLNHSSSSSGKIYKEYKPE
jgi:hypothetical protein